MVENNDNFHLYHNQNELSILLPFPPYFDKVEYGHILYIVCLFLNSWMSLFVMINILWCVPRLTPTTITITIFTTHNIIVR
jgi:hypothetical protein